MISAAELLPERLHDQNQSIHKDILDNKVLILIIVDLLFDVILSPLILLISCIAKATYIWEKVALLN